MKHPGFFLFLLLGCSPAKPGRESPNTPPPPASAPPLQLEPTPGEPFQSSPACSDDAECGWARCNRKAGRCAFPCANDGECVAEARCVAAPGNRDILVCAIPSDAP